MMAAETRSTKRMMSKLFAGLCEITPPQDREITGLSLDSRRVHPGDLFIARTGARTSGHHFIHDAIRAGAVAVVTEASNVVPMQNEVPIIGLVDLEKNIGVIADRFYDQPSQHMYVTGITGTNGKTSCSWFLAEALSHNNTRCGVIGTLGSGLFGQLNSTGFTTPDALTVQQQLADLRASGVQDVVMEVSSHGLDQYRVTAVHFDLAIYTNLTHEHLDYHGDMDTYALAKRKLFDMPGLRHAVINADDAYGRELLNSIAPSVEAVAYSCDPECTTGKHKLIRATRIKPHTRGTEIGIETPWGNGVLQSRLLGRFNVSNLLAVLGALLLKGMDLDEALTRLSAVHTVPGRMQCLGGEGAMPLVVVDYAHTPDALAKALAALREHCTGRLWCVFGCGGERDSAKRPLMGEIAAREADEIIVTDDNPRHEDPDAIIRDIRSGISQQQLVHIERNRAQAITQAITSAEAGDVVLIAGKGHEDYQLVGDERRHFSDIEQVQQVLGVTV